jgi:enoyl-[acyl-carrier protein] reductase II
MSLLRLKELSMGNRLTKLLSISFPVIQGGMAWTSDAVLAAAVSNAGGAGIIGSGGRTVEWVRAEITKAKSLTDKPFGLNIMLKAPNVAEIVEAVCQARLSFVTTGAGNPVPFISQLHAAGVKVIPVVPNVRLAKRVAAAGVDALVIEGMEGGGHIGTQTTMALLTNVLREHYEIPVLAAGGIADGRGLSAALLMGADGVQIGTRFLVTRESPAHAKAKAAIVEATDTDSAVTGFSRTGRGVRCLENEFTAAYHTKEIAGVPDAELDKFATGTNRLGILEGDLIKGTVMCGESLNAITDIPSCKEVMDKLISEARATLQKAAQIKI